LNVVTHFNPPVIGFRVQGSGFGVQRLGVNLNLILLILVHVKGYIVEDEYDLKDLAAT